MSSPEAVVLIFLCYCCFNSFVLVVPTDSNGRISYLWFQAVFLKTSFELLIIIIIIILRKKLCLYRILKQNVPLKIKGMFKFFFVKILENWTCVYKWFYHHDRFPSNSYDTMKNRKRLYNNSINKIKLVSMFFFDKLIFLFTNFFSLLE